MASLLSTKQISALLKTKRKQYVESVVGLGHAVVVPKGSPPGTLAVLTPRTPVALVWTIKSLPARQALAARNIFRDVGQMQLRKVPNGVVKSAARGTPFELMMVGPTLVATPRPGVDLSLPQLVDIARTLQDNPAISKGLLFTGLVHDRVFMTSKRLKEVDFEEPKKVVALVAGPAAGILQTLAMGKLPLLATLDTYHRKLAKDGNADAAKALGIDAPAEGEAPATA